MTTLTLNPLSEARDWTCVLMNTSRIPYCWATRDTPLILLYGQELENKKMKLCVLGFLNWSIVDLQCVNFCCTAKWFIYTYLNSFLIYSFPLCFIIRHQIYFSMLYSKILLIISFMYNSLYLLDPTSHSILPPTISPWKP